MAMQIGRLDLIAAFALGAALTIADAHFQPVVERVQTHDAAIIIPTEKASAPTDPDAGTMDAEPDRNNWDPRDGEAHYGDKSAPNANDDDDDDLDDSYDPPGPDDTTPI